MLKTLNTESMELKKDVIRVGGGRKKNDDRAKPVGKDEINNNKGSDNEVRKKD